MLVYLKKSIIERTDEETDKVLCDSATLLSGENPDIDFYTVQIPSDGRRSTKRKHFRNGVAHLWGNQICTERDAFVFEIDRRDEKGANGASFIKMDLISFMREINFTALMRIGKMTKDIIEVPMCGEGLIGKSSAPQAEILLHCALGRRFFLLFVGEGNIVGMENESDEAWEQRAIEMLAGEDKKESA